MVEEKKSLNYKKAKISANKGVDMQISTPFLNSVKTLDKIAICVKINRFSGISKITSTLKITI